MFAYQTLEQYELKQAAFTLYGYLTANPGTREIKLLLNMTHIMEIVPLD